MINTKPDSELSEITIFSSPIDGALRFEHVDIVTDWWGNTCSTRVDGRVVGLITQVVPRKRSDGQYNHQTGTRDPDIYVHEPHTWALVAVSRDEVLDELREKTTAAENTAREAAAELMRVAELGGACSKRVTELEKELAEERNRLSAEVERSTVMARGNRKLESDLAKIRQHIGQKAVDEALSK